MSEIRVNNKTAESMQYRLDLIKLITNDMEETRKQLSYLRNRLNNLEVLLDKVNQSCINSYIANDGKEQVCCDEPLNVDEVLSNGVDDTSVADMSCTCGINSNTEMFLNTNCGANCNSVVYDGVSGSLYKR